MPNIHLITNEELQRILEPIKEAIRNVEESKKTPKDLPEFLTTKETAKLLKVSEFTVREWTKKNYLVRYMIASRYRYKTEEVLDALKRIESRR